MDSFLICRRFSRAVLYKFLYVFIDGFIRVEGTVIESSMLSFPLPRRQFRKGQHPMEQGDQGGAHDGWGRDHQSLISSLKGALAST